MLVGQIGGKPSQKKNDIVNVVFISTNVEHPQFWGFNSIGFPLNETSKHILEIEKTLFRLIFQTLEK